MTVSAAPNSNEGKTLNERPSNPPLRHPVDDAVRRAAKEIVRTARQAALGTLSSDHGGPMVSRVNVATTMDGSVFFLISALTDHFKALARDPRASLLVGEPGKGDPLAHPRLTLGGRAVRVDGEATTEHLYRRYLARHPKSQLYIDLPDFAFWRLAVEEVSFNGGFARAYRPAPSDLLTDLAGVEELVDIEAGAVEHMNAGHADAVEHYARLAGRRGARWRLIGLDPEGLDLAKGDVVARLWFEERIASASDLRPKLVALAQEGR